MLFVFYNMVNQPAWPIAFGQWILFLSALSEIRTTFCLDFRGTLLLIFFYLFFIKNYLWGMFYWLYLLTYRIFSRVSSRPALVVVPIFMLVVYFFYLLLMLLFSWYHCYIFELTNPLFIPNPEHVSFARWLWRQLKSWPARKELRKALEEIARSLGKKE